MKLKLSLSTALYGHRSFAMKQVMLFLSSLTVLRCVAVFQSGDACADQLSSLDYPILPTTLGDVFPGENGDLKYCQNTVANSVNRMSHVQPFLTGAGLTVKSKMFPNGCFQRPWRRLDFFFFILHFSGATTNTVTRHCTPLWSLLGLHACTWPTLLPCFAKHDSD